MSRKKILFVLPSFAVGGTTVCLSTLLSLCNKNDLDVDVFALDRKGPYIDKLTNCNVLPENIWLSFRCYNGTFFRKIFIKILRILRVGLKMLGFDILPILCKIGCKDINSQKYDAIINFSESTAHVVCNYVGLKKITWIHCEYPRLLNILGCSPQKKVYNSFDKIVCVSDFTKSSFLSVLPMMESKTIVIYNPINDILIKQQAADLSHIDSLFQPKSFTIISVGRLDPVKQFDCIPQIVFQIKQKTTVPFKWFIIGGSRGFDGYVKKIYDNIHLYGAEDDVLLLGEKTNIYPYIAGANLTVVTSLSETFSLVAFESKSLGVPVIVNDIGFAPEAIQDGIEGRIVSIDKMADTIADLLNNPNTLNFYVNNLSNYKYDNSLILKKFIHLL